MMGALLVLDCSAAAVSVGIVATETGLLLSADSRLMPRGQVEALLPMIAAVQRTAGVAYSDLGAIAATIGPGSFTGIRLGLAAARGIGLATGRPVFGISSFAAAFVTLAADLTDNYAPLPETVLILLESKRQDVFAQAVDTAGEALTEPQVLAPEAVRALAERLLVERPGRVRVTGDAAELAALDGLAVERVPSGPPAIAALAGYACAVWRVAQATGGGLPPASPLYLRPPDAVIPKGGGVIAHLRPFS
jgi:tRNA threonylcarbamoyladenosine biosynthesis protein TsaB